MSFSEYSHRHSCSMSDISNHSANSLEKSSNIQCQACISLKAKDNHSETSLSCAIRPNVTRTHETDSSKLHEMFNGLTIESRNLSTEKSSEIQDLCEQYENLVIKMKNDKLVDGYEQRKKSNRTSKVVTDESDIFESGDDESADFDEHNDQQVDVGGKKRISERIIRIVHKDLKNRQISKNDRQVQQYRRKTDLHASNGENSEGLKDENIERKWSFPEKSLTKSEGNHSERINHDHFIKCSTSRQDTTTEKYENVGPKEELFRLDAIAEKVRKRKLNLRQDQSKEFRDVDVSTVDNRLVRCSGVLGENNNEKQLYKKRNQSSKSTSSTDHNELNQHFLNERRYALVTAAERPRTSRGKLPKFFSRCLRIGPEPNEDKKNVRSRKVVVSDPQKVEFPEDVRKTVENYRKMARHLDEELKDHSGAIEIYETAIEIRRNACMVSSKSFGKLVFQYGLALHKTGRKEEAKKAFGHATAVGFSHFEHDLAADLTRVR